MVTQTNDRVVGFGWDSAASKVKIWGSCNELEFLSITAIIAAGFREDRVKDTLLRIIA
jgi:hypothetical protein